MVSKAWLILHTLGIIRVVWMGVGDARDVAFNACAIASTATRTPCFCISHHMTLCDVASVSPRSHPPRRIGNVITANTRSTPPVSHLLPRVSHAPNTITPPSTASCVVITTKSAEHKLNPLHSIVHGNAQSTTCTTIISITLIRVIRWLSRIHG